MTTVTDLKDSLLAKASEDTEFRTLLISDPKAAIASEIGVAIPEGFDVVVHEDNATTVHLVLPPSPQLSEAELEKAAGGIGGYIAW